MPTFINASARRIHNFYNGVIKGEVGLYFSFEQTDKGPFEQGKQLGYKDV